jgi:hypothetical protein
VTIFSALAAQHQQVDRWEAAHPSTSSASAMAGV